MLCKRHTRKRAADHHRILVLMTTFIIASASLIVVIPTGVKADIYYYITELPSGSNSSYVWSYGHYHSDEGELPEAEIADDDDEFDLYTTLPSASQMITVTDFTDNTSWVYPDFDEHYPVGDRFEVSFLPPDTATITSVLVVTRFGVVLPAPGTVYFPSMYLSYSLDDSDYDYSALYPASMSTNPYILWNVTNEETWTPALLNTSVLGARIITLPQAYVHYYLDYVGFVITWYGDYLPGGEGGGEGGGGDPLVPDIPTDYGQLFTVEGIPTILGIVGFFGMMFTAPLGIYLAQTTSESNMVVLVKMIAMFTVFLTFFMVSVT